MALDDYRVELERLDVPEQHAGDGGLIRPAEVRGPTPVSGSDIGYASDASASAVHLATINSRPLSIASSVAAPASGSFRVCFLGCHNPFESLPLSHTLSSHLTHMNIIPQT